MANRCGGGTADAPLRGGRDRRGAARQRNRHEGRGRGEQDGVRLGASLLEDAAFLDTGSAQAELLIAREEEGVRLRVQGDDLIADDGHAQTRVGRDPLDLAGRGLVNRSLVRHGGQRARCGQGVDGPVEAGHEGARPHVRGKGRSLREARGAGGGGRGGPQRAVGSVEDAEDVTPLHRARAGGQGRRRAEGDLGDVDGGNGQ